jgi:hypothetical protein
VTRAEVEALLAKPDGTKVRAAMPGWTYDSSTTENKINFGYSAAMQQQAYNGRPASILGPYAPARPATTATRRTDPRGEVTRASRRPRPRGWGFRVSNSGGCLARNPPAPPRRTRGIDPLRGHAVDAGGSFVLRASSSAVPQGGVRRGRHRRAGEGAATRGPPPPRPRFGPLSGRPGRGP